LVFFSNSLKLHSFREKHHLWGKKGDRKKREKKRGTRKKGDVYDFMLLWQEVETLKKSIKS